MEASGSQNSELLWGIRGAGQFLGLVIDLTIRTYPVGKISVDGSRQLAMYFFTADKAKAVCEAMASIANDTERTHIGQLMAINAPPDFKHQALLIALQFFGAPDKLAELCQPLADLGPIRQTQMPSDFEHHSDHLDFTCAKGDFKSYNQIGVSRWDANSFLKVIELHSQLVKECPGSEKSSYSFEWHTPTAPGVHEVETSFGLTDQNYWM